jgi:parallel beta-helix repeat protein
VNENDTGIRLRPQANPPRASTGNVIEQNITTRSRAPQGDRGGINLQGASTSGNQVRSNQIADNTNGIALTAGPVGNRFSANALRGNTCAIKGAPAGNVFLGNTFQGNAANFCP